jgi:HEAT repeat protein
MVSCLQAADSVRVFWAARLLAQADATDAVPALAACLEQRCDELDDAAIRSLVRALGLMPHRLAVPALTTALGQNSRKTQRAAAGALAQIRSPEAREALEAAKNELPWTRRRPIQRALRFMDARDNT